MARALYTTWISNSERVLFSVDDTRLIFANHLHIVNHLHNGPLRPFCKIKGQTGLIREHFVAVLFKCKVEQWS